MSGVWKGIRARLGCRSFTICRVFLVELLWEEDGILVVNC